MTHAALLTDAEPLAAPARPELTDGRRIGVLLSHGFTGSPSSMKPWARALADRGYGISVPRLPGHGTSWQDLNTKRWPDWYGEVNRAFDALRAETDVVVVAGLSMGGALMLQLAADRPDEIAGVIVVNPAVASRRFDVKLLPVIKHLAPSFPGIADDIKKPGQSENGYTRTPLKAIHSFMQAWPNIIADLPKVTAPLLYLRSDVDNVVDSATEPMVLGGVGTTDITRVALPESYHVATIDNDLPTIIDASAEFVARVAKSA